MKGIGISDANKDPIDAAENHPQALLAAPCGGTSGHTGISGYQHGMIQKPHSTSPSRSGKPDNFGTLYWPLQLGSDVVGCQKPKSSTM
jgi:hypothetical protein